MTEITSDAWPRPIRRVAFLFAMSAEGTGFARRLGLEDQGSLDTSLPAHWLKGRVAGSDGGSLEVAVGFAGTDPDHGVDRIGTVPAALAAHLLIRRFEPDLVAIANKAANSPLMPPPPRNAIWLKPAMRPRIT